MENTVTQTVLSPAEVAKGLKEIFGSDAKPTSSEFHDYNLTRLNIKNAIQHEQLEAVLKLGTVSQVRSGLGITISIKTEKGDGSI
ncbi:hypothetical protein ACX0HA_08855 [Flavobacterium hauense]